MEQEHKATAYASFDDVGSESSGTRLRDHSTEGSLNSTHEETMEEFLASASLSLMESASLGEEANSQAEVTETYASSEDGDGYIGEYMYGRRTQLTTPGAQIPPICCPSICWNNRQFLRTAFLTLALISSPLAFLLFFRSGEVSVVSSSLVFNSMTQNLNGTQYFEFTNNNFLQVNLQNLSLTTYYYSQANHKYFQFENPSPTAALLIDVPRRSVTPFVLSFKYRLRSQRVVSSLYSQCNSGTVDLAFHGVVSVKFLGHAFQRAWGPLMITANCTVLGGGNLKDDPAEWFPDPNSDIKADIDEPLSWLDYI